MNLSENDLIHSHITYDEYRGFLNVLTRQQAGFLKLWFSTVDSEEERLIFENYLGKFMSCPRYVPALSMRELSGISASIGTKSSLPDFDVYVRVTDGWIAGCIKGAKPYNDIPFRIAYYLPFSLILCLSAFFILMIPVFITEATDSYKNGQILIFMIYCLVSVINMLFLFVMGRAIFFRLTMKIK